MILLIKLYPNQMDKIQDLKAHQDFMVKCGFRIENATGMNKYVKEISWQIGQQ